jgi:PAS domain S-box-containing protein
MTAETGGRKWPAIVSKVASLMRERDWAATSLGVVSGWPRALTCVVDLMLINPTPMLLYWGPQRIQLFNDAAIPLLGGEGSRGLGHSAPATWHEQWDLEPHIFDRVLTGLPQSFEDRFHPTRQDGVVRSGYYTLSLSPLVDDDSKATGVLMLAFDTTRQRSESRYAFLLTLTDAVRKSQDTVDLIATASELLGRYLHAGQVAYAEIDERCEYATIARDWNDKEIPGNAARHRLKDFGPAFIADLKYGADIIIGDVREDPRTATPAALATFERVSIAAVLNIPIIRHDRLVAVLAVHSRTTRRWSEADASVAKEVANRVWTAVERNRAELALQYSEARFRQFGEASTDLLWIRDAQMLEWEYVSPAFEAIFGEAPGILTSTDFESRWTHLIHGGDRSRVFANLARIQAGERVHHEFRIRRAVDAESRWIQSTDFPILDESGTVRHIAGIARDVTEQKETSDRMRILLSELDHRSRNLIVVIGSIVKRTLAASHSLEAFKDTFEARLAALGRVNALLVGPGQVGRVTFAALLQAIFRGHGLEGELQQSQQIRLVGESNIELKPAHVQTLGLALHELLTNALKYGALTVPTGLLEVRWAMGVGYDNPLNIEWLETHIPDNPGSNQQWRGYGRELIEEALPYQLQAVTAFYLNAGSLKCTIRLPNMAAS